MLDVLSEYMSINGIMAFAGAFFGLFLGLGILLYAYYAFALMTIAKKLKFKDAWIAWIPVVNMFLIPILAKKEWYYGFIFLIPFVNMIFYFMWTWQIYERRNYPGMLALIPLVGLIPFLAGLASLAQLIVFGFVAWYDRK